MLADKSSRSRHGVAVGGFASNYITLAMRSRLLRQHRRWSFVEISANLCSMLEKKAMKHRIQYCALVSSSTTIFTTLMTAACRTLSMSVLWTFTSHYAIAW